MANKAIEYDGLGETNNSIDISLALHWYWVQCAYTTIINILGGKDYYTYWNEQVRVFDFRRTLLISLCILHYS